MYQKLVNFMKDYPQKTTRGDNWPAAITGRLPVHVFLINVKHEHVNENIANANFYPRQLIFGLTHLFVKCFCNFLILCNFTGGHI